jgi:CspA family cold shock protein
MGTKKTKVESGTGKVKFFNNSKGFGFIAAKDGKEYFVHFTGLLDKINADDEVEFDLEEGNRGLKAVNVKLAK